MGRSTPLTELDLTGNKIGDDGARRLGSALAASIGVALDTVAHQLADLGACPPGGWTNALILTAINNACSLARICAVDNRTAHGGGGAKEGGPSRASTSAASGHEATHV